MQEQEREVPRLVGSGLTLEELLAGWVDRPLHPWLKEHPEYLPYIPHAPD